METRPYTSIPANKQDRNTELEYHHFAIPNGLIELDNNHQTVTSQEIWVTRHYIPPDTTYEGIFPNHKVYLTIHRKHRVEGAY